jgi:outer membrane protein OmpA-like peptidoglycan-associated protein
MTPAGLESVKQAANAYKAGDSVRLQVTGYSDPFGSPGYNQRLSQQCASNIANALAKLGVARSDISVNLFPAVGSWQNRRIRADAMA